MWSSASVPSVPARPRLRHAARPTPSTSLKPVGCRRASPIDNLAVAAGIFAVQMTRLSDVRTTLDSRSRRVVESVAAGPSSSSPVNVRHHVLPTFAMTSHWRHHPVSSNHFWVAVSAALSHYVITYTVLCAWQTSWNMVPQTGTRKLVPTSGTYQFMEPVFW